MGRMEEYYLWKRGELNKKLAPETLELFRTDLTDEQLVALEKYDKKILFLFIFGIIAYGLLGFLVGLSVGVN